MRFLKPLLVLIALLLAVAGVFGSILYSKGFFSDPQVAQRALQKRGIPVTAASVHRAAAAGDRTLLTLLARAKADFAHPDKQGRTALHHALAQGHVAVLGVLREQKYDLDARDQDGHTPLSLTLEQGLHDLAGRLIEEGASPDFTLPSGELALPGYHRAQRLDEVAFLLRHGANPDSPNLEGQSTLALALQSGQPELACQLVEKGADPNGLLFGEPLLAAVLADHAQWDLEPAATTRILSTLLVAGANPEQANSKGQRPLQIALRNNFLPALELLLPRVQDVSQTLWLAIQNKNFATLQNLLDKGASVEELGPDGETPLLHAIRHNQPDLLALLLEAGADPNQFCNEGQPALFFALALRENAVLLPFLAHRNRPQLDALMSHPVSEEFRDLFAKKGLLDWYCRNEKGLNPLMVAVMLRNLRVVEQLLARPEVKRGQGTSRGVFPIQMAAANRDIPMQQLLLGVSYREEDQIRKFVVELSKQQVTYYKNGTVNKTSRISSGMSGFRTPPGEYVITDKNRHHRSNIYQGAEMPYFQRFSCGAIGFHEGNTGSRYASHGCIRLPRATAQYFWKETKVGDRVSILP